MKNLYYGDNLEVLRESIKDESIDLIYLDPPFNSKRGYNLLFKSPDGHESNAQITAFDDSWHWNAQAEHEFNEILHQSNTDVAEMMQALRKFLGENDMMAYLTMMCNRLLELRRVLKPTGSLYLHCDPTASHYLKIVLDGVFGNDRMRSEIIWLRSGGFKRSSAKKFPHKHDTILFYSKTEDVYFRPQFKPHKPEYLKRFKTDDNGKLYRDDVNPTGGGTRTIYLDDVEGDLICSVWTDIHPINPVASERLGYPTQKPLALLERIIHASCPENGVVLDPFCGCGTAVHAAEKQNLNWIGIDITHLAVSLIEKRLKDAFPKIQIEVHGTPKDFAGAFDLFKRDAYQFQWWACSLVNAQPYQGKKKGADGGIDGLIFFQDDDKEAKKIIISVKGGANIGVAQVRDLGHVVEREKAAIGIFVTLTPPTSPMKTEAIKTGYYESKLTGNKYPKLQILTIEGLMSGTERPQHPQVGTSATTFKKAKTEDKSKQHSLF